MSGSDPITFNPLFLYISTVPLVLLCYLDNYFGVGVSLVSCYVYSFTRGSQLYIQENRRYLLFLNPFLSPQSSFGRFDITYPTIHSLSYNPHVVVI